MGSPPSRRVCAWAGARELGQGRGATPALGSQPWGHSPGVSPCSPGHLGMAAPGRSHVCKGWSWAGLQLLSFLLCIGQDQSVVWADCACLKAFGVDNLISATPFLASLSTC